MINMLVEIAKNMLTVKSREKSGICYIEKIKWVTRTKKSHEQKEPRTNPKTFHDCNQLLPPFINVLLHTKVH